MTYLSIVVGWYPGELIKPYDWKPDLTKMELLHERIKTQNSKKFPYADPAISRIDELSKTLKLVEVFGAWERACVLKTVYYSASKGIETRVPKGLTFNHNLNPQHQGFPEHILEYSHRNNTPIKFHEDDIFYYFKKQ